MAHPLTVDYRFMVTGLCAADYVALVQWAERHDVGTCEWFSARELGRLRFVRWCLLRELATAQNDDDPVAVG